MSQANRLRQETSPYLQQHADNAVDWYPWGKEALQRAHSENKPILLSIGYSACHWCHVMAHESFEDQQTADVMNQLFINIKVDREERPDLDKIYQRAHQLLTQRTGGWPLTVFLMPDDHMPFFAGTYFPKEARYQLPSFVDLMNRIAGFFQENPQQLRQQNHSLQQAMQSLETSNTNHTTTLTPVALDLSRRQLEDNFDWEHGGFGNAPKFPHPTNIERLLRHWAGSREDTRALEMACLNLQKMANGGINDQLGGGFCRYSVDDVWMIPHFEKMLYDNGSLLTLYSQAWHATGDPLFHDVIRTTTSWVMREMQATEGGYYSSLDADSEGEEGKFYAWTKQDLKQCLDNDEFNYFSQRYGINNKPNFEAKYYPYVCSSWQEMAEKNSPSSEKIQAIVNNAREKLFKVRETRHRPGRDEKILCSWNALMIKGMASAGRYLNDDHLIDSAFQSLDFIKKTLWKKNRLLATYKDGRAHLNAYLDDYVFLIDAIIELMQARWRDGDITFAIQLTDTLLEQFEDKQKGGFFFTSNDHEQLIERPKSFGDEAIPSGNGIAAHVLIRLAHIVGNTDYSDAAERTLKAAWPIVNRIPSAHNTLLLALEETLYPPQIIVMRGEGKTLKEWQAACVLSYAPRRISLAIPANATDLPGLLSSRKMADNRIVAYICEGTQCQPPVTEKQKLDNILADTNASATLVNGVTNK